MKCLILTLLFVLPPSYAQEGTVTICKGVTVPDGYTILKETTSTDCPNGAYLLKKSNTKPVAPTKGTRLTEAQVGEVKELLLLVDLIELQLSKTWNSDNDFGVSTERDFNYTKGAMNAVQQIAKRLDKLPNGAYKNYLSVALFAYVDVGRMRLHAGTDGGATQQREIAKSYKLEGTEPHLWAWSIWQVARLGRNLAARELNLPIREYDDK